MSEVDWLIRWSNCTLIHDRLWHSLLKRWHSKVDERKMRQEERKKETDLEAAGTDVIRDRGRKTEVDGEENGKRQTQRRKVKFRTLCVSDCSPGSLLGFHWASWRCPPWPSTGCAGWGSTWRELLSDRGSAAHTAPLSQTVVRQWPCDESEWPPHASIRILCTELSTRPGGPLPLLHRMHSPPVAKLGRY